MLLGFYGLTTTNTISLPNQAINTNSDDAIPSGTSAEESRLIDLVEKASPAVVSIVITQDISDIERFNQENSFFDDLFDGGLGTPRQNQDGSESLQIGGGSGFFISSDGYLVTNKHVVNIEDAEYTVLMDDGERHKAQIVAKDSTFDVAILKVSGNNFPYLTFADSDTVKLGQTAIAIGNALAEFRNSISSGIVSGLSRSVVASDGVGGFEQLDEVIQTDAAINPGNSGGPLLDIRGNVIGVNVAVQDRAENIGFALPSNMVKSIADSVRIHGKIIKPYLGVRYTQINNSVRQENNLSVNYGILVSSGASLQEPAVVPDSPADKAGIKENDIILEIDGTRIDQNVSFISIIRQKQVDQTITLKILRDNNTQEVKVTLEQAPNNL